MSQQPKRKTVARQRTYSVEDIDRGLAAVAYFDGNTRRAHAALKQQGLTIPRSTILDWTNTRQDRYIELRDKLLPQIHAKVAEEHQELARTNMEVERATLERIRQELPNIAPRDLANVARNVATGAGIHQDKSLTLRGMAPNAPVVSINIGDQIRSFAAKGYPLYDNEGNRLDPEQAIKRARGEVVEGTATELPGNTLNADNPKGD